MLLTNGVTNGNIKRVLPFWWAESIIWIVGQWGYRWATALHYVLDYKRWNFKAQYTTYDIHLADESMDTRHQITLAAFGATYQVTSKSRYLFYGISLSHSVPKRFSG